MEQTTWNTVLDTPTLWLKSHLPFHRIFSAATCLDAGMNRIYAETQRLIMKLLFAHSYPNVVVAVYKLLVCKI